MSSKIKWGKTAGKILRFTLKLMLITINVLIEIGFDSKQKSNHPFGKIEARAREENGMISQEQFSRVMND